MCELSWYLGTVSRCLRVPVSALFGDVMCPSSHSFIGGFRATLPFQTLVSARRDPEISLSLWPYCLVAALRTRETLTNTSIVSLCSIHIPLIQLGSTETTQRKETRTNSSPYDLNDLFRVLKLNNTEAREPTLGHQTQASLGSLILDADLSTRADIPVPLPAT